MTSNFPLPDIRHRILITILAMAAIAVILLDSMPGYLYYTESPVKSDATILFIGPDNQARQREAHQLITEGYAKYLIIPAFGRVQQSTPALLVGEGIDKGASPALSPLKIETTVTTMPQYLPYFEKTHIEVLEARRIMDEYGLKSALFVSSPYHMRRIRMMAEQVFVTTLPNKVTSTPPEGYTLHFVPTRFEPVTAGLRQVSLDNLWVMSHECLKIAWFQIYHTIS
jgi:hypothetical protein